MALEIITDRYRPRRLTFLRPPIRKKTEYRDFFRTNCSMHKKRKRAKK